MKRLIACGCVLAVMAMAGVLGGRQDPIAVSPAYTEWYIAGDVGEIVGYHRIPMTNMTIYRSQSGDTKEFPFDALGVSRCYSATNIDLQEILQCENARILHASEIANGTVYTCYAKQDYPSVTLDGQAVNMQIACVGDKIWVGIPMLMGSY